MAKKSVFRRFRGVDDKTLALVLDNHAGNLRGQGSAVTMLLRERRLLHVWHVLVTVALAWLLWGAA